jgi:hypothetical protein
MVLNKVSLIKIGYIPLFMIRKDGILIFLSGEIIKNEEKFVFPMEGFHCWNRRRPGNQSEISFLLSAFFKVKKRKIF